MSEIAPLVILTSHLKKDVSKRDIAEAKKPLIQKSFIRIYFRHTPNSPLPTGLFLKRPLKMDFSNGMKPINVVQRKVVELTWEKLIYFWNNPVGNTPPTSEEQLNEFEMSILDGILTPDQKNILKLAVIEEEREREEEAKQARLQKRILQKGNSSNGTPKNAITLLTQAFAEYKMDSDSVAETLGLEIDEVMALPESEVKDAWEKIKAAGK
jgi:hypothetical protein